MQVKGFGSAERAYNSSPEDLGKIYCKASKKKKTCISKQISSKQILFCFGYSKLFGYNKWDGSYSIVNTVKRIRSYIE